MYRKIISSLTKSKSSTCQK